MKRKKKNRANARETISQLVAQPPSDFYRQPILHINCRGEIQVENCKAVLEYTSDQIKLDMGRWNVSIGGSDLELCSLGGPVLILKGTIFKAELFYKERAE